MKIIIVSDSHGNHKALSKLAKKFGKKAGLYIHLGDESDDAVVFERENLNTLKVPGIFEVSYALPHTKNRLIHEVHGKKLLLTHTHKKNSHDPAYKPPLEQFLAQANAVLYGHTHIPAIEKDLSGKFWINPGHLKENDNRGFPMSYAVMEITDDTFNVNIYRFDNDEILLNKTHSD